MTRPRTPPPDGTRGWPYFGRPQKMLVFAGLAMWAGVALPWFFFRPLNITRYASPLAASWVLWAGLMAMAGAMSRWLLLMLLSAVAAGGTAVVIAGWQLLVIGDRCGFRLQLECLPGPGAIVVLAAGAYVLYQIYVMRRATAVGR